MALEFTLLEDTVGTTTVSDVLEVDGIDVAIGPSGMFVSDSGDLAVVSGPKLASQSVVRELPANPGSFPRRPEWGGGLQGLMFKGATNAVRDKMQSRAHARLLANERIVAVREVSAALVDGSESGLTLTVRAESIGGVIDEKIVIKPPGVS